MNFICEMLDRVCPGKVSFCLRRPLARRFFSRNEVPQKQNPFPSASLNSGFRIKVFRNDENQGVSARLPMKTVFLLFAIFLLQGRAVSQSLSFQTFMNPVIPGDHPDCTLSKIGTDFYTTGSSFNITPVIYHSTDLVHWEAVAQPVSAAWSGYGNAPAGGCWGGQVVFFNNKYWHFFSRSNTMYFTTAEDIRSEWTLPTRMNTPAPIPGLGYDNSIFIDDDGSWILLSKNGQENNWIVQLGEDDQPIGTVYDLS